MEKRRYLTDKEREKYSYQKGPQISINKKWPPRDPNNYQGKKGHNQRTTLTLA